ncbi:hypothetical protein JIN85_12860 [Luteolibacter pohnpeiensis]|uniref:Uncharacterized protein n=1 Tax=Luteolibacter pohnpeiensis TaxID=454153 RepID=A0A934VWI2_9BACT|nr:hypothetical protein [Luteolibacter pohnpeiensis]MBK1883310.1 hypothetical protein [Luteolibacter pohnpeiensis]
MKSPSRLIFLGTLAIGLIVAAILWFMPYDWKADSAARFKVEATQITRDHSYFWLDVHLVKSGSEPHVKEKPVWLQGKDGEKLDSVGVTFGTDKDGEVSEIWYKFWVPESAFHGPLTLHLNEGELTIRSHADVPSLEEGQIKVYRTKYW